MAERRFEISVSAWDLDEAAWVAMFDRVADAAHALDEQVTCTGGIVEDDTPR